MKRKYSDEEIKNYIIDRETKSVKKNREIENVIKKSMKYTEFSIKQKMVTRTIEPEFLIKNKKNQLIKLFDREFFENIYDKLAIKNHRYVYAAVLVLFVVVITPKIMKQSQQTNYGASEMQKAAPVLEIQKAKKAIPLNAAKENSYSKGRQIEMPVSGNISMQQRSEKSDTIELKEKRISLPIESEVQSAPSVSMEEFKAERSEVTLQDSKKEEVETSKKDSISRNVEVLISGNLAKGAGSESLKPRMEVKRRTAESPVIQENLLLDSFEKGLKKLMIYREEEVLKFENMNNEKIIVEAEIDEKEMLVDLVILNSNISKEKLKEELKKLRYDLRDNNNKISGKIKLEINIENGVLKNLKIVDII